MLLCFIVWTAYHLPNHATGKHNTTITHKKQRNNDKAEGFTTKHILQVSWLDKP